MYSVKAIAFRAAALAAALLLSPPCLAQSVPSFEEHWTWGSLPEASENRATIEAIQTAVAKQDFAALDARRAAYLGSESTTPSGNSRLEFYYSILISELSKLNTAGTCFPGWRSFVDGWQKVSPRSAAPIIVEAGLLEARAWCYRGDGVADTVPPGAWKPFKDNVDAAVTLLEKNRAKASIDPEFYATLEGLYGPQGRTREQFQALLDEASARYPYYYNIYYAAIRFNEPQWSGSLADIDTLADYAAAKTGARDGMAAYARVYWYIYSCGCYDEMGAVKHDRMMSAMAELGERYPGDYTYIHLAKLACALDDPAQARKYFTKLTINEADLWAKREWDMCRDLVGPSKLPLPESSP